MTDVPPKEAFLDGAVAAAYRHRPQYPAELIERLTSLAGGVQAVVLDLGCGTGDISRPLARGVTHIHAVDPSGAMLDDARGSTGGDAANVSWHLSTAEQFEFPSACSLIVAAESIHWMDLDVVFAKARQCLQQNGVFAVVGREYETPWDSDLRRLTPEFSATRDFVPFDVASIELPGRMKVEETVSTPWSLYKQSIDDYRTAAFQRWLRSTSHGFGQGRSV